MHDIPAIIRRFALSNICNMDQTPLPFEYLEGRTHTDLREVKLYGLEYYEVVEINDKKRWFYVFLQMA